MSIRWYSVVVDSRDMAALSTWWATALGWQVSFQSEEEIEITPPHAGGAGDEPGAGRPPSLVFVSVPELKQVKNRLHIDVAPRAGDDQDAEVQRLLALGATRADVGQEQDVTWVVLADPEGNEFCVLTARD